MEFESARIAYAPFKRFPASHVFIIFTTESGDEIAISPEANVMEGATFSLVRGLVRTYTLRYRIQQAHEFQKRYVSEGRTVRHVSLPLTPTELTRLFQQMSSRAAALEKNAEWYNTFFNSCVTNTVDHIDEIRVTETPALKRFILALSPARLMGDTLA